jgi:hypothetical protein
MVIGISVVLDPFVAEPRIADNEEYGNSTGIKFRKTGVIPCVTTHPSNIVSLMFFPCFSSGLSWVLWEVPGYTENIFAADPYPDHFDNEVNRSRILRSRIVSSALRLKLTNNSSSDDGYWEATRLNLKQNDYAPLYGGLETGRLNPWMLDFAQDISNHASYQFGLLKDIHKFQFELNQVESNHPFVNNHQYPMSFWGMNFDVVESMFDPAFDAILIQIHGRMGDVFSELMYDVVSNQEVVYTKNTILGNYTNVTPAPPARKLDEITANQENDVHETT